MNAYPLVVIYGGSFDPVHLGHEAMTEQVIAQLKPQKMHIIPCHMPPHKAGHHASNQDRSAMLIQAFGRFDEVQIDARELEKTTVSYTVETVKELRKKAGPNVSLCFMLGQDSWLNFTSWHRWQDILDTVNILVVNRPGATQEAAAGLAMPEQDEGFHLNEVPLAQIGEYTHGKIAKLPMQERDIASSVIRTAITDGKSINHMVSQGTADYIQKHKLYI